jgi:hypothetical protein
MLMKMCMDHGELHKFEEFVDCKWCS